MSTSVLLFTAFIIPVLSIFDQRTVNVALETSLLFEPKAISDNLGLIHNLKSLLDKILSTLEPQASLTTNSHEYRNNQQDQGSNGISLPEILQQLGQVLQNFSNDGIQNVTNSLKENFLRRDAETGSSFHEIFSDPTLKKFLKKVMHKLSKYDGDKIKKKLQALRRSDHPELKSFTERLSAYYTKEDLKIFHKFVKKLDKYTRKNKDTNELIQQWLDYSVFDRYDKLNTTAKAKLLGDMKLLVNYITGKAEFRGQNVTDDAKLTEHTEVVSGSEGEGEHKHHRHSHVKKVDNKDVKERQEDTTEKKTEVIVDNVEFYLKSVKE